MAIAEQHVASAHTNSPTYEEFSWRSWLATVDHKKIGIIYIIVAFAFFVLGGIEAVLMRVQLGAANNTFLSAETYKSPPVPVQKAAPEHGISAGKNVFHTKFGEGKVLAVEGVGADARAQVNFPRHGVKWLALSVAKLTLV